MAEKLVKRKKKNLYKEPEKFEKGVLLKDTQNHLWKVVEPIGRGGFGVIYSAISVQNDDGSSSKQKAVYAIKVEPHENGPLFTEMHFFIKVLKSAVISEWKKEKKISFLGVPQYHGNGSCTQNGARHRFLVMDRFGQNINSKMNSNSKLSPSHLRTFGLQIVDALHFIHDNGYAHGDVKDENLLLAYNSNADEIYLVDYGLVRSCYTDENFQPDKKCQHNGTLVFCSCDAHRGRSTKRGDLEMLGFNLLVWSGFTCPWINDIGNPEAVYKKKMDFMSKLDKKLLDSSGVPPEILEYLQYVKSLEHYNTPDYDLIRRILSKIKDGTTATVAKRRIVDEVISVAKGQKVSKKKNSDDRSSTTATLAKSQIGDGVISVAKGQKRPKKETSDCSRSASREIPITSIPSCSRVLRSANETKTVAVKKEKSNASSKTEPGTWRDCPTIKASKQPIPKKQKA